MKRFEPLALIFILLLLTAAIYGPTLPYPHVFDDEVYLVANPIFKDPKSFANLFLDLPQVAQFASKNLLDPDLSTNFIMRPLTYGTFHLNFRFGGMQPWGFRLVNISIHLTNALLVWHLSRLFLKAAPSYSRENEGPRQFAPALASLIFFLHPLQLESAIYLIQRATSLCTLFYLLGLICHFHANASTVRIPRLSLRAASFVSVFAAMLSKESAVTAPILAVALDVVVFGTALKAALRNAAGLLLLVPYLPIMLMKASAAQIGEVIPTRVLNITHGNPDPLYALHYLMSQTEVWWRYMRLFFWPTALNIDPEVPMITRVTDLRFLLSLGGWAALFASALLLHRRSLIRPWSAPLYLSLLWFFITVSPDSSFVPLPDLMAEHRTYLPIVGLCIGCAAALLALPIPAFWTGTLALLAVVALGTGSVLRSHVWSSPIALWADAASKSPGKVRCLINLGAAYFDKGDLPQAEAAFRKSLEVEPTVPGAANLAWICLRLNQPERAATIALRALSLRPTGYDHFLLNALGEALVRSDRHGEAVPHYEELLQLKPALLEAIHNLGVCYLQTGQFGRAREVFIEGLRHHPNHPNLLSGLAAAEAGTGAFKLQLAP